MIKQENPHISNGVSKTHLFTQRIRKINSIDKEIRRKWGKLNKTQCDQQANVDKFIEQQNLVKSKTTSDQKNSQKDFLQPLKVAKIRSEIIREEVNLRNKLYNQVFFRKKKRDPKPEIKPIQYKAASSVAQNQRYHIQQKDSSPIMLKKRTKTLQRELQIIRCQYEDGLREVSEKKGAQGERIWGSQKDILNKIKGTKFYYQMAASWDPKA